MGFDVFLQLLQLIVELGLRRFDNIFLSANMTVTALFAVFVFPSEANRPLAEIIL